MNEIKNWWPYSYRTQDEQNNKYCFILLNQPILDAALAVRLWTGSSMKVTVDGGTSIWAKLINNSQYSIEKEVPDLITGDFDSADKENIEYFKRMGAEVIETMDQDRTDFTKCLDEVGKRFSGTETATAISGQISGTATTSGQDISVVYAYVENSGRLDQIMANIQTLFLGEEYLGSIPMYLINSQSISWLLQPGKHSIHLPEEVLLVPGKSEAEVLDSLHCGLIPLAGPTIVTSTGLKWNLNADELKFGALVSTSNAFASKEIVIETNKPLLWTMDIIT